MGYLGGSRKIERGPQNYKGASGLRCLTMHVGTVLYAGIGVSRGRTRPGGFGVSRRGSRRSRYSYSRVLAGTRFSAEESVRDEETTRVDYLVARDA